MSYRATVQRIVRTVVEPRAAEVDRDGRFPREAVRACHGVLGLTMSRGVGGGGHGLAEASWVVERFARACASTGTVLQSHFAAAAALDRLADRGFRGELASGRHLASLAVFGADGWFLSPAGTAVQRGTVVDLRDRKSGVVSAAEADSYLWSALDGRGRTALWLVPGNAPGLLVPVSRQGIGLRGNASTTVWADPAQVPADCALGDGFDALVHRVLPWHVVLGASVGLGIMEGAIEAAERAAAPRASVVRMRLRADAVRVLHADAVAAVGWEPERARRKLGQLAVASAEAVTAVTDLAVKTCGDAAFDGELGLERRFRDARALCAMAPTADAVVEFIARGERLGA
ncbi:acyl-CoA dehydrogenase family protein [Saccharothrix sp.]|uniref:acyl-CoA dehydrogenase family protein n=1 Tax=Saccharothrix sp. TaxID=1873460 RepID=UPI0028118D8F|nr:acyl-CoA dehydrogenase family protein [Saccharothrix sp.]